MWGAWVPKLRESADPKQALQIRSQVSLADDEEGDAGAQDAERAWIVSVLLFQALGTSGVLPEEATAGSRSRRESDMLGSHAPSFFSLPTPSMRQHDTQRLGFGGLQQLQPPGFGGGGVRGLGSLADIVAQAKAAAAAAQGTREAGRRDASGQVLGVEEEEEEEGVHGQVEADDHGMFNPHLPPPPSATMATRFPTLQPLLGAAGASTAGAGPRLHARLPPLPPGQHRRAGGDTFVPSADMPHAGASPAAGSASSSPNNTLQLPGRDRSSSQRPTRPRTSWGSGNKVAPSPPEGPSPSGSRPASAQESQQSLRVTPGFEGAPDAEGRGTDTDAASPRLPLLPLPTLPISQLLHARGSTGSMAPGGTSGFELLGGSGTKKWGSDDGAGGSSLLGLHSARGNRPRSAVRFSLKHGEEEDEGAGGASSSARPAGILKHTVTGTSRDAADAAVGGGWGSTHSVARWSDSGLTGDGGASLGWGQGLREKPTDPWFMSPFLVAESKLVRAIAKLARATEGVRDPTMLQSKWVRTGRSKSVKRVPPKHHVHDGGSSSSSSEDGSSGSSSCGSARSDSSAGGGGGPGEEGEDYIDRARRRAARVAARRATREAEERAKALDVLGTASVFDQLPAPPPGFMPGEDGGVAGVPPPSSRFGPDLYAGLLPDSVIHDGPPMSGASPSHGRPASAAAALQVHGSGVYAGGGGVRGAADLLPRKVVSAGPRGRTTAPPPPRTAATPPHHHHHPSGQPLQNAWTPDSSSNPHVKTGAAVASGPGLGHTAPPVWTSPWAMAADAGVGVSAKLAGWGVLPPPGGGQYGSTGQQYASVDQLYGGLLQGKAWAQPAGGRLRSNPGRAVSGPRAAAAHTAGGLPGSSRPGSAGVKPASKAWLQQQPPRAMGPGAKEPPPGRKRAGGTPADQGKNQQHDGSAGDAAHASGGDDDGGGDGRGLQAHPLGYISDGSSGSDEALDLDAVMEEEEGQEEEGGEEAGAGGGDTCIANAGEAGKAGQAGAEGDTRPQAAAATQAGAAGRDGAAAGGQYMDGGSTSGSQPQQLPTSTSHLEGSNAPDPPDRQLQQHVPPSRPGSARPGSARRVGFADAGGTGSSTHVDAESADAAPDGAAAQHVGQQARARSDGHWPAGVAPIPNSLFMDQPTDDPHHDTRQQHGPQHGQYGRQYDPQYGPRYGQSGQYGQRYVGDVLGEVAAAAGALVAAGTTAMGRRCGLAVQVQVTGMFNQSWLLSVTTVSCRFPRERLS